MGRMDDLRRLSEAAKRTVGDPELTDRMRKAAGDAVTAASSAVAGAESVARRSGMTTRSGRISKFKMARSALTPAQTARTVLDAAAEEIREHRATGVSEPEAVAERTIPALHPDFFTAQLRAASKPLTTDNLAAVARLASANIALNAHRWLEVLGTPESRHDWDRRFYTVDEDAEAACLRPDLMIDFLWARDTRLHSPLDDLVAQLGDTIVSAIRRFGPQLPADLWNAD
jgi:hypothetical protein